MFSKLDDDLLDNLLPNLPIEELASDHHTTYLCQMNVRFLVVKI